MTEPHWLTAEEMNRIKLDLDMIGFDPRRWREAILSDEAKRLYAFDPTMTHVFGPFTSMDEVIGWQESDAAHDTPATVEDVVPDLRV